MAEQTVELAPGESKEISFEAIPKEVKTYSVSVNGLVGSFKAIAAVTPKIANTSWEIKFIGGAAYGGELAMCKVTVSSPRAFSGRIVASLPGKIAGETLLNYIEWQNLIQWLNAQLAACTTETCSHHYELRLDDAEHYPEVAKGFYLVCTHRSSAKYSWQERRKRFHLSHMERSVDSISRDVSFPAGDSEFDLAFYILPDELAEWLPDWYRIRYDAATYSPVVNLYEGETLLDSVEDVISFPAACTGNCY